MFNFITRFFQTNHSTQKNYRERFAEYFFSQPEHQWFDEQIHNHFQKLFKHLPVGVLKYLQNQQPVQFIQAKDFNPGMNLTSYIVIFPEFEKLIRSSKKSAVAFLAQELALILLEAEESHLDELTRELEADKFVSDLGFTFELEELLLMLDESVEKRMRLCYLTSHHFSN
ncbi:MAG: hypothetical protein WCY48_08720 [Candidatus Caldatribacteriota bacterium]